jgi:hypothetical protein
VASALIIATGMLEVVRSLQCAQHFVSCDIGQMQVQEDQIGTMLPRQLQAKPNLAWAELSCTSRLFSSIRSIRRLLERLSSM